MYSLFFWRNWPANHRTLWFALSILFLFSLAFLWFGYFRGTDGVIEWEKIQEQKTVETTIHEFRLGPFTLNVPAESYVIFEFLQGGDLHHNTGASYVFLAVLIVCSMVLLTVLTTLPGFWYYGAMALFILFVASLRLDVVLLFGVRGYAVPIVVVVLFLSLSYYFKGFRRATGFSTRFVAFLTLAAIVGLLIYFFSVTEYPMLHLAVTAYLPGLILTVLFILMVAHEIIASFVFIAGQGKSKTLQHFLIISAIYLVNVFITCLHEIGVMESEFIYVNLYLLLCTSTLLGLWGFRLKEPVYESILPFYPVGAFFYLALATVSIVTISEFLGNANDAVLKVVRDVIIFSHFGYGLIFLGYIFSNFMAMMADNLPVYRLLYKPNRMPFFTFRLAGLIATLAFVFYSNWRQYVYHGLAGFYNYVADLYMMQNNEALATAFYDESRKYGFQNHRANYALARIKSSRLNFKDAHHNYELANGERPSEFSLVNAGNLYAIEKKYFPAIRTYQEGKEAMPSSAALSNNLGLAYAKVHALDSATHFFDEAREDDLTRTSAEANFLAMAALEYLPIRADSVLKIFRSDSPMVVANALAAATLVGQQIESPADPLANEKLDLRTATLLNNYCVYQVESLDTAFLQRAYNITTNSANAPFSEALQATLAHAYYRHGNVTKALQLLAELAYITQDYKGKYNYIMGLWTLDQGNPVIASSYFHFAELADYKNARFYNAIALTEAGRIPEAFAAWQALSEGTDAGQSEVAKQMQKILTIDPVRAASLSDAEKYQYCRYRIGLRDTVIFHRIIDAFKEPNYKAQALLDMAEKQFEIGNVALAISYMKRIDGLELTNRALYDAVKYFELRILASQKQLNLLRAHLQKGVDFREGHELEGMLYTALLSDADGQKEKARKYFSVLGTWNPYFEEGILAAADFFRKEGGDSMKPYNILVEAIQVNNNSYRLLKAYAGEAERLGFDEYAESARMRMDTLRSSAR